jgi:N-acetylglutamate synthase-like GNAT family acetyltransferase
VECMLMVRKSERRDLAKLISSLEKANISTKGVEDNIEYFVLLEDKHGDLAGTLGIEPISSFGLLRSLVVTSKVKEEDVLTLFQHVYKFSAEKELSTLYLVTNKEQSIPLLNWLGFRQIPREELPLELEKSTVGRELKQLEHAIYMETILK